MNAPATFTLSRAEADLAKLTAIKIAAARVAKGTPPGSAWSQYESDVALIDEMAFGDRTLVEQR